MTGIEVELKPNSSISGQIQAPVCLYGAHMEMGLSHSLNDCSDCPEDENERLLKACFNENWKSGLSKSTRRQLQKVHRSQSIVNK